MITDVVRNIAPLALQVVPSNKYMLALGDIVSFI